MTSHPTSVHTTGLLLAAGAGRRYGQPKGTVVDVDGAWVVRAARALLDGGCAEVLVVTGAEAEQVETLLAAAYDDSGRHRGPNRGLDSGLEGRLGGVRTTRCGTWEQGMGESLRAGLTALATRGRTIPQQALVHLVDLPDVSAKVVARVLATAGAGTTALARAAYDGRPGHPVLIGRDHWDAVLGRADGDAGARGYLRTVPPVLVECGDLASGTDVDEPSCRG